MRILTFYISILLFTSAVFAQTPSFQDTQGKLEVSQGGQATYTLPIAMPPSIKNTAPIINLVYSSGQRGGIAGQGWNISSISSITRMSTRKDIDGFRDGVDFDANDKLALDGQRLLLKTGVYWENGSTYETEYKSNIKIQLDIVGADTFFTVTYPDGSQAKYGNFVISTADDPTTLNAWCIKEFKDSYGNMISYNYTIYLFAGKLQNYINSISFSGNSAQGIANLNKIKFNYRATNASRVEADFIKGEAVYASKILDNIQVLTNNVLFRKYQLTQVADDSGYERVSQIQEFNGALEASNPILFEYDNTSPNICFDFTGLQTITPRNLCPIEQPFDTTFNFNSIQTAGDFDGDGQTDFISGNNLYTGVLSGFTPIGLPATLTLSRYGLPTGFGNYGSLILPVSTSLNNKLNQFKSVVGINETATSIKFRVHNLEGNIFNQVYEKNISIGNTATSSGCQSFTSVKDNNQYLEGDFNGDGLSEILMLSTINQNSIFTWRTFGHERECWSPGPLYSGLTYSIIDLNINSSTTANSQGYSTITNNNLLLGAETIGSDFSYASFKRYVADFNGDGKSDVLRIDNINKTYLLITFKQLSQAPWTEIEILGQGTLPNANSDNPVLLGDYNGDGKSDIMIPNGAGSNWWVIYYANPNPAGGAFFKEEGFSSVVYTPAESGDTYVDSTSYHAIDINKDGKTDLVSVYLSAYKVPWTINNWDSKWRVIGYTNNTGKINNERFTETYTSPLGWSNAPFRMMPFVTGYKYQGQINDVAIINSFDHKLLYYKFSGDYNTNNRLKTVKSASNNIVQTIDYAPMKAADGGLGTSQDFYSSTASVTYPNIEVVKNADVYLVSKITATVNGVSKFQDFKYHGMISNFEYGSVGFKRTARSSWYSAANSNKIWTVQNNDPALKGANTITWTTYNGDFVFETVPLFLLSTSTNEFETYTNPTSKQYNVLLKKQTVIDHLTTVKSETLFTYDGLIDSTTAFGLQTKSITNKYLGTVLQGTTTTDTSYLNNSAGTGAAYFIGKPQTIDTSTTIYPNDALQTDLRTSKEIYTYTGANITKIEKRGHNTTNPIFEDMTYDNFGNLLTKKISCPGAVPALADRTITDEYDTTKRFVKKKTDHQGFVTLFEYNGLGQVTKSTNYLGVVNDIVYDSWGKQTTSTTTGASTTALMSTTAYAKQTDGGYITTSTNNVDGAENTTRYDVLGQVVKSTTKGFAAGTTISKSVVYDILGRKTKEYEPYFFSQGKFTEYEYDYLNRPVKVTATTGRIQTLSYSGLTTTSLDNTKPATATLDALGNKVTTTDEGGTINFKYYANGQLKESDYGGHKITIAIDGWGNKTSMNDPNAGTYTYVTDEFGQSKTETTPKGATNYAYDSFGKLLTKTVLGDGADYVTTYAYNALAQLKSEISKKANNTAIDSFVYGYDSLKRLNVTTETNTNFTHSKTLEFDTYSRLASETNLTTDTASGFSATVVSKSNYNAYNGIMDKMTDANNAVLWQLNSANAKMQALTATLGNGVAITNTYDADSYCTSQRHKKGSIDVLYNTYDFDAIKGTLKNRQNVPLARNEGFSYDNLDRLTAWGERSTSIADVYFNNNNDEEGFIYNSDSSPDIQEQGFVTAFDGVLLGEMYGGQASVIKQIMTNGVVGQSIKIKYDFVCGASGVFVSVYELNPVTGAIIEFPYNTTERYDTFYTREIIHKISNYSYVYFKINMTPSNPYPTCNFTLDNFKVEYFTGDSQTYDDRGRITDNAIGTYKYTNAASAGMYRKTSIKLNAPGLNYYNSKPLQTVSYTMFKSPIDINESSLGATSFNYNSHLSRTKMRYNWTSSLAPVSVTSAPATTTAGAAASVPAPSGSYGATKFYTDDGSTEIIKANGKIKIITYIGGNAYSAPLYNEKIKTIATGVISNNNYYLHRDHLGSIIAISNSTGVAVERRHFDAWGNLTKLQQNGVLVAIPTTNAGLVGLMMLDRGYTSHEHLAEVGLVQMNGRLYDPVLHTFLMPDNFVQQPENTQNYNRYAYVLNNPLMYTDPSGEFIPFLVAVAIGAVISAATYTITCLTSGATFSWGGLAQATFIGAASAAVTFGIGSAAGNLFTASQQFAKATFQALAHGAFQGALTDLNGGNFWNGFAAGALSSIAASAFSADLNGSAKGTGWAGVFRKSDAGMIAFGTVAGGAGSALTGGNFWQGAVTGLVVSGLNHAMHKISDKKDLIARMKKGNINPSGTPDFTQKGVANMNNGVEGLNDEYAAGGKPEVKFDSTDNSENGHTEKGIVHLNKSTITNNYRYASTLFHEYRHAWQWIYKTDFWESTYNSKIMYNLMERDAYGHQIRLGIYNAYEGQDSIIRNNFDKYSSLTSFIKHF